MTKRDLFKSMHRAFRKVQDLDDLMKVLVEAGKIAITDKIPESGGPRTYIYHVL